MKITVHAHWLQNCCTTEPECYLSSHKMTNTFPEYIYAGEFDIDLPIEPPNHATIVAGQVASLRKEQGELIHKSDLLEERIQRLMAIEHKPEVQEAA